MKDIFAADEGAGRMLALAGEGARSGILFGPERMGLSNDDVALADAIISFPVSPAFKSINLAQAVLLVGYEWWKLVSGGGAPIAPTRSSSIKAARSAGLRIAFNSLAARKLFLRSANSWRTSSGAVRKPRAFVT